MSTSPTSVAPFETVAQKEEASRIRARRFQVILNQFVGIIGKSDEVYLADVHRHAIGVCNVGACPKDSWAFMIIRRPAEPEDVVFTALNDRGGYRNGQELIAKVVCADGGGYQISQPLAYPQANWSRWFRKEQADEAIADVLKAISIYDYENRQVVVVEAPPEPKKRFLLFG